MLKMEKKDVKAYLESLNQKDFNNFLKEAAENYEKIHNEQIIIDNKEKSSLKDGSSPHHYYKSLNDIENWIQKCIDEIRIYLKPICYPLYIHLYLSLINNRQYKHSENFLNYFRKTYKAFEEEIEQFALAKGKLDDNHPLKKKYIDNKTKIFIPDEIFKFFLHFLNTSRLILVLEILNKHFERSNVLPRFIANEEKNKFLLLNNSYEDIEKINCKTEIYCDKVNKDIISNLSKTENKDSTLNKIIMPLPEISNEVMNGKDNPLKINKTSPPNIGCFTLLNTNNKLNCIEMTNDGGIIVCGFKNGEIVVWILDQNINIEITQDNLKNLENHKYNNNNLYNNTSKSNNKILLNLQDEKISEDENDINNKQFPESQNSQFLYELITKSHRRFSLYGHQSTIYSLSISPDNEYLISGSYDGTIRLWNLHTKTCFSVYKGHFCPVLCVKFSPISHYFASGGCDKTARLWSVNSKGSLRIFLGHLSDVELVDFHPNGLYLLTSANDKMVRMWIINTGECCRIFMNYSLVRSYVDCMCFSNNGKLLAVGFDKGMIIYDLTKKGEPLCVVNNLTEKSITSISFDNDDNVVVCCTQDYKVNFYDIESVVNNSKNNINDKKVELIYSYVTKKTTILQVKFTNNNLLLLAGRFDDNDPKIFN